MEVFIVGSTEEEIQNGYLNYELIKKSLVLMRLKSLMKRKHGMKSDLDNLLNESIKQRIELGITTKVAVKLTDISSASYFFNITYRKAKGDGGKKRIHTDSREIIGDSEEMALRLLSSKIFQLKEVLVEVISIEKNLHSITTIRGDVFLYHQISITK